MTKDIPSDVSNEQQALHLLGFDKKPDEQTILRRQQLLGDFLDTIRLLELCNSATKNQETQQTIGAIKQQTIDAIKWSLAQSVMTLQGHSS
jgi:hypothetical protein